MAGSSRFFFEATSRSESQELRVVTKNCILERYIIESHVYFMYIHLYIYIYVTVYVYIYIVYHIYLSIYVYIFIY